MQQRSLVRCNAVVHGQHLNPKTLGHFFSIALLTYISKVKGYLKVPPEVVCKTRVDVKDLQQVIPQDAMQITVGDCVDI